MGAGRPPDPNSTRQRVFDLLDADPTLTSPRLAALLGCPLGTAKHASHCWAQARGVVRRRTVVEDVEPVVAVPLSEWQRRALRCATDAELRLVAPWMMDLARQEGIVP